MAKEIHPFAYIVQGDFAGMYVYYQDYDDKYFVRSESVYKDGFMSMGIWYNASYQYKFRDIIGYEDIGSASHSADAASVLKAGFWLGAVGAMAATAAGSGTTYDTAIYFKDGKKCVFRFLNSQVHQNHITSFHQLNIKPGSPTTSKTESSQPSAVLMPTGAVAAEKQSFAQPIPLDNPLDPQDELVTFWMDIATNLRYDLYLLSCDSDDIQALSKYTNGFTTVQRWEVEEYIEEASIAGLLLKTDIAGEEAAEILKESLNGTAVIILGAKERPQEYHSFNNQTSSSGLNYEELKQLKELLDMGILTQEEFDAKKKQLLGL